MDKRTAHLSRQSALSLRLAFVALSITASIGSAWCQERPTEDPTAPLRRFPISLLVRRPDLGVEPVSILRLSSLHPRDEVLVQVDERLKGNWTLVATTVGAGQKIRVQSWNLWEKRALKGPIATGMLPDADVVPLYFLVLNKPREHRILDGVRHALETSSQQIVSQTAIFQSKYTAQNRLLNFMTAYASLGPKECPDPRSLKNRVDMINLDLGANYDPTKDTTSPGQMQHQLDAGVGVLDAMRQSPDNPLPAAAITRSQLPSVVSDWLALAGDLVHLFIRPPHDVKFTFVPASAVQPDEAHTKGKAIELVTQRVLETSDNSLPSLVYRPTFERQDTGKPIRLNLARNEVVGSLKEVAIPLAAECRELFDYPYAWGWEASVDGSPFAPLAGAHLAPGRGLVFPVNAEWWGAATSKQVYLRTHIGFDIEESKPITVVKALPQNWALDPQTADCAQGDPSDAIRLSRSGNDQPFYRFGAVYLRDASGRIVAADDVNFNGALIARFNLGSVVPGLAQVFVQQENSDTPDRPVDLFIAPKHPVISISCGRGDRVLRISGAEAGWVKAVQVDSLYVQETDESEAGIRKMTLSGALPSNALGVEVTYRDPQRGLEWTRYEPVSVGLPRPRIVPFLAGALSNTVSVGSGADPSWATATIPEGWVRSKQPLRIQMSAVAPFSWSHDLTIEGGFGSSGDVQSVFTVTEGPSFSLDGTSSDAYLTLSLETMLPPTSKRNSGLLWLKLSRTDLSSPWILVTERTSAGSIPVRVVKLPVLQSVQTTATGIRVTLSSSEQVLGAKFAGQSGFTAPQLQDSQPGNLIATFDGPAGATEFDLQLRDAPEGVVHIKIVKTP